MLQQLSGAVNWQAGPSQTSSPLHFPSLLWKRKPGKMQYPNFPDDSAPKPLRELQTDLIPAAFGSPQPAEPEPGDAASSEGTSALQAGP